MHLIWKYKSEHGEEHTCRRAREWLLPPWEWASLKYSPLMCGPCVRHLNVTQINSETLIFSLISVKKIHYNSSNALKNDKWCTLHWIHRVVGDRAATTAVASFVILRRIVCRGLKWLLSFVDSFHNVWHVSCVGGERGSGGLSLLWEPICSSTAFWSVRLFLPTSTSIQKFAFRLLLLLSDWREWPRSVSRSLSSMFDYDACIRNEKHKL